MKRVSVLLALAASIGGCTALVDVDDYTFDDAPCGVRPSACTGGHELAFIAYSSDVPRLDAAGHRDGFDLDGTDASICGQRDFTSSDGRTGIDNGLAEPFELLESLAGGDIRGDAERLAAMGMSLQLIVLTHVDDLANDDCIDVTRRAGALPDGVTAADLDRDHDGLLDANLAFDYYTPDNHDPVACVIDHVVHARFGTSTILLPGIPRETRVDRIRLRMRIEGDLVAHAVVAGSIPVEGLVGSLPDAAVDFLRPRADLDPSSRTARDCRSISCGFLADFVPCTLGALRMP